MGYPNVTMIYTRPFAPPNADLAKNAGQKTGKNKQVNLKVAEKAQAGAIKQVVDDLQQRNTANAIDDARDTLLNNRYQYGLNSAGVFVYAHDPGRLFGEVAFLNAKNITTQYDGGAPPTAVQIAKGGKWALIRPISDERGFEVRFEIEFGENQPPRQASQ